MVANKDVTGVISIELMIIIIPLHFGLSINIFDNKKSTSVVIIMWAMTAEADKTISHLQDWDSVSELTYTDSLLFRHYASSCGKRRGKMQLGDIHFTLK